MLPAFKLKTEQLKEYQKIIFSTLSEVVEEYYKLDNGGLIGMTNTKTKTLSETQGLYTFVMIASKLTLSAYQMSDYLGKSYHICYPCYWTDRFKSYNISKESILKDYNNVVKIFSHKLKQVYGNRVF